LTRLTAGLIFWVSLETIMMLSRPESMAKVLNGKSTSSPDIIGYGRKVEIPKVTSPPPNLNKAATVKPVDAPQTLALGSNKAQTKAGNNKQ